MSLASLPTLLLVPPVNLLLVAIAGAALRRRRGGRALLATGLGGLYLLALPVVSGSLMWVLETGLNRVPPADAPPQAIAILSGDQVETRGSGALYRVGALTLEREQAGAALARRTGLPILVSGGQIHPWSPAIASLMAASLHSDFATEVRWQEVKSVDTWGNARESAALLRPEGITHVWVVTQAWHMKRALVAFRRAGLEPVAAPVLIDAKPSFRAGNFLPSAQAWLESYYAMHELIGWAWYAIRP